MSGRLPGLRRRLAKAEKVVVQAAERERLANCNCKRPGFESTTIRSTEELRAEMRQLCPVHGIRHPGTLVTYTYCDREGNYTEESKALNRCVELYTSLCRLSQAGLFFDFLAEYVSQTPELAVRFLS